MPSSSGSSSSSSTVVLNEAVGADYITFLDSSETAQIRFVLVGVGLMLLMIYRPQGILGDRREIALDDR